MKNRSRKEKGNEGLQKYLSREIVIEYKVCLYFSCILFFYFLVLVLQGIYTAQILYMCEMILSAYVVGYLQMYVFHNFDEAEGFGRKELGKMVLCSLLYVLAAHLMGWYDNNKRVEILFFLYMMTTYGSIYLFHRLKRKFDTRNLNRLLTEFKEGEDDGNRRVCD